MNSDIETEALDILQEECAELIQAASKIKRFGIKSSNPELLDAKSNRYNLIQEMGDVLALIDILKNVYEINDVILSAAKQNKLEKLTIYSNLKDYCPAE